MTLMGRFNELLHQLHSLPLSGTSAHQHSPHHHHHHHHQQHNQQQPQNPSHHRSHHNIYSNQQNPSHNSHHQEQLSSTQSTVERASQQLAPSEDENDVRTVSNEHHSDQVIGTVACERAREASRQIQQRTSETFNITGFNQKQHRTVVPSSLNVLAGVTVSGEVIHTQQDKPSHRQAQKSSRNPLHQQQQQSHQQQQNQKTLQLQSSSSGKKVSRHNSFTNSTPSQTSQAAISSLNRCENLSKAKVARSKSHHSSSSVTSNPQAFTPLPSTQSTSSSSSKSRAQRIEHLKLLLAHSDIAKQQIQQHKQQQRHRHRSTSQPTTTSRVKQDRTNKRQHVPSKPSSDQSPVKNIQAQIKNIKNTSKSSSNTVSTTKKSTKTAQTSSATVESQESKQNTPNESALNHKLKSTSNKNILNQEYSSLPPFCPTNISFSSFSSTSSAASSVRSSLSSATSSSSSSKNSLLCDLNKNIKKSSLKSNKLNNNSAVVSDKVQCSSKTNQSLNKEESIHSKYTSVSHSKTALLPSNKNKVTANKTVTSTATEEKAKKEEEEEVRRAIVPLSKTIKTQNKIATSSVADSGIKVFQTLDQPSSFCSEKSKGQISNIGSRVTVTNGKDNNCSVVPSKELLTFEKTYLSAVPPFKVLTPTTTTTDTATAAATTSSSFTNPSAVMRNSKKKHETICPTSNVLTNNTTLVAVADQNDTPERGVLQVKCNNKLVVMDLTNNNNNINNNNMTKDEASSDNDSKMPLKGNPEESQPIEESFASKFARKMNKVATLARKSSNAANISTQALKSSIEKSLNKASKQTKSSKASSNNKENVNEGCFIHRYLNGHLTRQHPDIISGKTCYDLPVKDIALLSNKIVASCTGPHGGLLTINTTPAKPFDLADQVDFIDEDYPDSSLSSSGQELHSPHRQAISQSSSTTSDESLGSSTNSSPINSPANDEKASVAGLDDWHCARDFAYGISTSLYELHPFSKSNAGDPIADSFALVTRENSAVIALADGVNWGQRSSLASRSAIHGCMDYLNRALYSRAESTQIKNTMDVFVALLRSFRAAHNLILAQGGHLTTLCAAVICQLKDSNRFIVCTCNVGDSFAYVWSQQFGVREITEGSHDIFSMRDMRDALGALGPVSGDEPELNNLTVSMTVVDEGDIIFLTSDGITDNFDPVVGKFAMPRKDTEIIHDPNKTENNKKTEDKAHKKTDKNDANTKERKKVQRSTSNPERRSANFTSKGLPLVSGKQRHELTLLRMEDLINNGVNTVQEYSHDLSQHNSKAPTTTAATVASETALPTKAARTKNSRINAKELCSVMVDFATKLSVAKRRILEDEELYSEDDDGTLRDDEAHKRQKARRRKVGGRLMQMPGKLDHASIAAVEVGFYGEMMNNTERTRQHLPRAARIVNHSKSFSDARYNLKAKATLARFESQESLDAYSESGPI